MVLDRHVQSPPGTAFLSTLHSMIRKYHEGRTWKRKGVVQKEVTWLADRGGFPTYIIMTVGGARARGDHPRYKPSASRVASPLAF